MYKKKNKTKQNKKKQGADQLRSPAPLFSHMFSQDATH